jgi:phosphatidate cytidylyltransferase
VLRWRLISAAVILAVLLTLIWLDYCNVLFPTAGGWLLPLLLIVSVLGTEEVLSLLRAKNLRPLEPIVYLGSVLVPLAAGAPIVAGMVGYKLALPLALGSCGAPLVAMALLTALAFVGEMVRYQRPGNSIVQAALAIFAIAYIGLLITFWALLRLYHDNDWGMLALFSMLLVTKMADAGAFTFGKCFGRHKLTPVLSPGKTWEGAIGGILTACVTSWLFFKFGARPMINGPYAAPPVLTTVTYGALLAIAGMVGDLAESLLKRDMERKDSSTWLRGLGGVLDIIDSPLVAGPVAWIFWSLGFLGP